MTMKVYLPSRLHDTNIQVAGQNNCLPGLGLPIFSELVSDKFTVDNLGEISNVVKSNVLPITMIEWHCQPYRILDPGHKDRDVKLQLLDAAIQTDDMCLLKFIIDLGSQQQASLAQEEDDQKSYTISRNSFFLAIKLGRTAMLAEMIKVIDSPTI